MSRMTQIVKLLSLVVAMGCAFSWAEAGETAAAKPHMMYFYNPSCRMCTKTNEAVAAVEEKYKASMTFQRFNISDPKSGLDNVGYMFELMDEMEVPEGDSPTLVVFVGVLETENGEEFFTPRRVLVEGDEIIPNLDKTVSEFLTGEAKGGTLGEARPASFFLGDGAGVSSPS